MSEAFSELVLELLWAFETKEGEGFDSDESYWMASIADAISRLDMEERVQFIAVARRLALEAKARGDEDRGGAFERVADVEEAEAS